ncbi:hypothetical protein [Arthrobacter sp. B6]|uniref:hypothetical protein n=1 Tax=Arthrobacter sp. B6 TaxID=1570137 RepID=UPI00083744FD|nr:hypothetical protein [Arthrobacter sp. B6]
MKTASNSHFHSARSHTARPLVTHHSHFGAGMPTAASEYVGKPTCDKCGTDEFIYLESYIPPVYRRDGVVRTLGEVAYTCTRCEEFSAHSVPASWTPPGWYLG